MYGNAYIMNNKFPHGRIAFRGDFYSLVNFSFSIPAKADS